MNQGGGTYSQARRELLVKEKKNKLKEKKNQESRLPW
jgi:hypothetical protein